VYRFTTVFPAPGLVTLRAPVDDTVNQPINVTFAWNEGASALTYHLQVATDDAFAQVVFDDTSLMATEHDLTLEHSTTYFWRVRAINPVGQGDWSPPWSVTTLPPRPAAVVLGTPQDHALDQPFTLTLTWTPDAEATTHHLQVGIDSDFSAIFFEDTDLTATEQEIASLDDGVVYYWRVRGHNAAGFGPWSPVFQFTTAAAPGTLALTFPEDDAVDATSTITFAWEADRAADVYQIQVSRLPNFGQVAFQDFSLTEPMRTFGPLAYSARHYWRVRALNEIGTGPWSEVRAFRVAVGTAVERVDETIPTAYELHANYPNPFNPTTTLRFDLPASSEVTLVIYDMLGREVETLVAGTLAAGRYSFAWEATARPSGLYLARLRAGRFTQSRQMLLLK
jgi:hypothetical protein